MTTEDDFNSFWRAYPRRISKGAARDAFAKAIRKATLETMLAAIGEYIAHKPDRIDFKHPATWLNQECWDDEWASVPRETNQKRTFVDAARDRLNGRRGIDGSHSDAQRFPDEQYEPGSDAGNIRNGYAGPFITSRH